MEAISLRLEVGQYEKLHTLSSANHKSISQLIRDAIDAYLQKQPDVKSGQEWFWTASWQAAEQEVEADLAAGRVETFDTMDEFLESLE